MLRRRIILLGLLVIAVGMTVVYVLPNLSVSPGSLPGYGTGHGADFPSWRDARGRSDQVRWQVLGGFSTALVFVFGAPALWAFLSLLLVAWARLYRRKHNIPQLIAGALAGVLVAALVFGWLGTRI